MVCALGLWHSRVVCSLILWMKLELWFRISEAIKRKSKRTFRRSKTTCTTKTFQMSWNTKSESIYITTGQKNLIKTAKRKTPSSTNSAIPSNKRWLLRQITSFWKIHLFSEIIFLRKFLDALYPSLKVNWVNLKGFIFYSEQQSKNLLEFRCTPEEIIYFEGEMDDGCIYFLEKGSVELYIDISTGQKE